MANAAPRGVHSLHGRSRGRSGVFCRGCKRPHHSQTPSRSQDVYVFFQNQAEERVKSAQKEVFSPRSKAFLLAGYIADRKSEWNSTLLPFKYPSVSYFPPWHWFLLHDFANISLSPFWATCIRPCSVGLIKNVTIAFDGGSCCLDTQSPADALSWLIWRRKLNPVFLSSGDAGCEEQNAYTNCIFQHQMITKAQLLQNGGSNLHLHLTTACFSSFSKRKAYSWSSSKTNAFYFWSVCGFDIWARKKQWKPNVLNTCVREQVPAIESISFLSKCVFPTHSLTTWRRHDSTHVHSPGINNISPQVDECCATLTAKHQEKTSSKPKQVIRVDLSAALGNPELLPSELGRVYPHQLTFSRRFEKLSSPVNPGNRGSWSRGPDPCRPALQSRRSYKSCPGRSIGLFTAHLRGFALIRIPLKTSRRVLIHWRCYF